MDKRKEFTYHRVLVTPQPPRGLLGRHWKVELGSGLNLCLGAGYVLVNTKAGARYVIDALEC